MFPKKMWLATLLVTLLGSACTSKKLVGAGTKRLYEPLNIDWVGRIKHPVSVADSLVVHAAVERASRVVVVSRPVSWQREICDEMYRVVARTHIFERESTSIRSSRHGARYPTTSKKLLLEGFVNATCTAPCDARCEEWCAFTATNLSEAAPGELAPAGAAELRDMVRRPVCVVYII